MNLRSTMALVVASCMLAPEGKVAAQASPQPTSIQPQDTLRVFALVGEGAIHRVPLNLVTDVVVEVRDLNDLPVGGADIVFTLPPSGPGGSYSGKNEFRTKTDFQGQAGTFGFKPNGLAGRFQIQVSAKQGDRSGQVIVNQTNSLRAVSSTFEEPRRFRKRWVILSLVGAGAAAGIVFATRGGSSSASPVTIVLTPGAVGIGGPR